MMNLIFIYIGEELENLEFYNYLEEDELDILKGLIA